MGWGSWWCAFLRMNFFSATLWTFFGDSLEFFFCGGFKRILFFSFFTMPPPPRWLIVDPLPKLLSCCLQSGGICGRSVRSLSIIVEYISSTGSLHLVALLCFLYLYCYCRIINSKYHNTQSGITCNNPHLLNRAVLYIAEWIMFLLRVTGNQRCHLFTGLDWLMGNGD